MPRSIRREKKVVWGCLSQNLMPCSLTLLGIHFRNLHKIFSTFLQKLFDIVASHEVVVNILRALATQSMMLWPLWCSHTIEPNVATRFPKPHRHSPSKLRELVQVAASHEYARCRQTVRQPDSQTTRQSVRTTFNCFHCAQLGGKQATGTTATPSSSTPIHLKSCTLVVHTICSIHLKLSRGTCNAPLCNGQCAQLLTHNCEICEICKLQFLNK